jgi:lipopolysaccharide heptosyltransferase II
LRTVENILVIRFGALGDVILTLPVLDALKNRWPEARLSIAVKEAYASLFSEGSAVERVFALDGAGVHRGLGGFRRYAEWLRQESFDLVLDLHSSLRSRALAERLRASRIRRVSLQHFRRRALVRFGKPLCGFPEHAVDRFLATIRTDGDPPVNRIPRLEIALRARRTIAALLDEQGVGTEEELVCLAPGAGRWTKRWPWERYGVLAARLARESSRVVCVVGSDEEAKLVRRVADQAGHKRVFSHVTSDLMEHAAMMERASRLVTNDSGLMHLGVAAGTPVVALFGSTTPTLGFCPLGEHDQVLSVALRCRPCSLHGLERCRRGDLACLERISVDRVFTAVAGRGEADR